MITDAILRYDGAEPQAEAIDDRGAHAARGDAASDDHGVDSIFAEERRSRRVEEDRWRTLAQNIIVGRIRNQRVEFGARITVTNLGNPINFPVRRVPLGMVAHIAGRNRNAGGARDLQESCRVLDRPPYQRGSTGCECRIGERALEINHYDTGLLAEPYLPFAVAAFLVARHRMVSMIYRGSAGSARSLARRLMIEESGPSAYSLFGCRLVHRYRKFSATGLGSGGIDRETVVLDPSGKHDAVDVSRLFNRLPALQYVCSDPRRVARERIAIAPPARVAPAQGLTLLKVHDDHVRQLSRVAVVVDEMGRARATVEAAVDSVWWCELPVARDHRLHGVLERRVDHL